MASSAFEGLSPAALDDHVDDPTGAHAATAISVADAGGLFAGVNVETVLAELAAGGGGEEMQRAIAQTAHGLSVGNAVRHNGTIYVKAQADSAANAEVAGIVSAVADANNFTLHFGGRITGLSGLTAGTVYFLDDDTAGLLTATEPTDAGDISKPVLVADSTTTGLFFNFRGTVVVASATTTLRIPINLTTPRSSTLAGNSFWTVLGLTDWDAGHWELLKDVEGKIYGIVSVPANLAAIPSAKIILVIGANATSGVTRLQVGTTAVADTESMNPAALTDETAQDITVPATAYLRKDVEFDMTTDPTAEELLIVEVFHDGDHANDTLAVNTILWAAYLEIDVAY